VGGTEVFWRTFMRSVLLFPYVGPVVALAYTWGVIIRSLQWNFK
jgi:hypothetical protein